MTEHVKADVVTYRFAHICIANTYFATLNPARLSPQSHGENELDQDKETLLALWSERGPKFLCFS